MEGGGRGERGGEEAEGRARTGGDREKQEKQETQETQETQGVFFV